jgi:hypothetical protein
MKTQYKIKWYDDKNDLGGDGDWMDDGEAAQAFVDKMNGKFSFIRHWIVTREVEDERADGES